MTVKYDSSSYGGRYTGLTLSLGTACLYITVSCGFMSSVNIALTSFSSKNRVVKEITKVA